MADEQGLTKNVPVTQSESVGVTRLVSQWHSNGEWKRKRKEVKIRMSLKCSEVRINTSKGTCIANGWA